MKSKVHVFDSPEETIRALAGEIHRYSADRKSGYISIALSGGNTALKLFTCLKDAYYFSIPWEKFKVFWGDERCVPVDDPESNYGNAHHHLFRHVNIPPHQIYRMQGENEPHREARRYTSLLRENLPVRNDYPQFDMILLGMGADGHVASIFPDQMHIMHSENLCEVAVHPESGQQRLSLTGSVINNADSVFILVTGATKADALKRVLKNNDRQLPAFFIAPDHGILQWYLDTSAAHLLENPPQKKP